MMVKKVCEQDQSKLNKLVIQLQDKSYNFSIEIPFRNNEDSLWTT